MKPLTIIFVLVVAGFAAFGIFMGPPQSPEGLMAQLQDPSAARRAEAVRLLGTKRHLPAVPALVERINDHGEIVIRTKSGDEKQWKNTRATVGGEAISSLRLIGYQTTVPIMIEMLGNGSEEQKKSAHEALTFFTGERKIGPSPDRWRQWWDANKGKFPN